MPSLRNRIVKTRPDSRKVDRRPRVGVGLAARILPLLLCLTLAPSAVGAEGKENLPPLPVLLVNGAIYPGKYDPGDLPEAFRYEDQPEQRSLYLLQYRGSFQEYWLEEVRREGGEPRGYLDYSTLLVSADASSFSRLKRLGFVSWSGLYQPYYKLSPALQLRLVQGGEATVLVELFDGGLTQDTVDLLAKAGIQTLGWGFDEWCGLLVLRLPVERLREVAALPAVEWMELYTGGTLASSGVSSAGGKPGSGSSIFPAPGTASPRERLGLADTGAGKGDGAILPPGLRNRVEEVVSFRGDRGEDPHGHGTTVAEVLLADGYSFPGSSAQKKDLRLVVYATGYGIRDLPQPVSMLPALDEAYGRGIRTFLNGSVPEGRESLCLYGVYSSQRDYFAWTHPDMIMVEAAGNWGDDADGDGVVDEGSLLGGASAKNVISVGGCEGSWPDGGKYPTYAQLDRFFPGGFSSPPIGEDASVGTLPGMAAFSSRGPASDGRIKPDLVAPATGIPVSTAADLGTSAALFPAGEEGYLMVYGTSYAAALVAREAASLRGWLGSVLGGYPSAALVKAFLVGGAVDLHPGQYGPEKLEIPEAPNAVEGWGRMDVSAAGSRRPWIKVLDDRQGLRSGDVRIFRFEVRSGSELRVTLAWTDYPSLPQSRRQLVNDLDLRVIGPDGRFHYPNGRNSRDPLNNVERIVLDVSSLPGTYTVEISADDVPFGPQPYALLVQ